MMSLVIVETQYDDPPTFDQLNEEEERLAPQLNARQTTWRYSLLSDDHHRMICTYEAPDAETVRTGHEAANAFFDRIWTGELLELGTSQTQPSTTARIVMEATYPALSQGEWNEIKGKLLNNFSEQRIECLKIYRSLDRTTAIWELHAPDVQTVQSVQQQANVPCDRIWSAELVNPEILVGLGFSTQNKTA
jgi:hypothetical protein